MHIGMDHKLLWVVCTFLLFSCYSCVGDSLSVKHTNEPPVERIHFRPRAKVVVKPKDTKKEMLYGSVIWFKPKESTGNDKADAGNKVNDVIRLTSRNTNTFRGRNKSTVRHQRTESVKNNDEIETRNTENRQVSQASRRGKSIEQTIKGKGNILVKEVRRKPLQRTESDPKVEKPDRKVLQNGRRKSSQITRHQGNNGSTRINNIEQNIKLRNQNSREPENKRQDDFKENISQKRNIATNHQVGKEKVVTTKKEGSTRINSSEQNLKPMNKNLRNPEKKSNEPKEDIKDNISQNRNVAINHQDGKENVLGTIQDFDQIQIDKKDNKINLGVKPKIVEKVKDNPDQKNIEKLTESTSIKPTTKPKIIKESKNVSNSDKQKAVKNGDMLGMLLAQSDPGLLKVLIDNSSPENLNVFLHNSKITVEELKDIISY